MSNNADDTTEEPATQLLAHNHPWGRGIATPDMRRGERDRQSRCRRCEKPLSKEGAHYCNECGVAFSDGGDER